MCHRFISALLFQSTGKIESSKYMEIKSLAVAERIKELAK